MPEATGHGVVQDDVTAHLWFSLSADQGDEDAAKNRDLIAQRMTREQLGEGMLLGGSPNMLEEFPDKPKGMHWRIYERWRRVHDVAEERSTIGLMGFVERLGRRSCRSA